MTYLGVDTAAAHALVTELRRSADDLSEVKRLVLDAEELSGIASMAVVPLDQVQADWSRSASEIAVALDILEAFRVQLSELVSWSAVPAPTRTPVPIVPPEPAPPPAKAARVGALWNATPAMPWNEVFQDASHNSYAVAGGVPALFDLGVRTFELDIHRGPPASFVPVAPWFVAPPLGSDSTGEAADWRVYHMTGDSSSEYEYLIDGLDAVAGLNTTDPLTIFIDNKDAFGGLHTPERLDELLEARLGERLYRPADFSARVPEATSMHAVVNEVGWPTTQELDGRIMVVLTDEVDNYRPNGAAAFVAGNANLIDAADGVEHIAPADEIFINANYRKIDEDSIEAIRAAGGVVRTYFNPHCVATPFGEDPVLANYRAIDIAPDAPACGPAVHPPPVDTPVPIPTPSPG